MVHLLLALTLILILPLKGMAQTTTTSPAILEPETLNYVWVPKGSLQIHTNFLHTRSDNDGSLWTLPEAWLRYGLTRKLQAVFKPPNYIRFGGQRPARQGWESIYTGAQYNLDNKPGGIDAAIETGVWLPTRSDGMDFQNVTPELKAYYQQPLPKQSWFYVEIPVRLVETSPRAKFMVEPFAIAGHVIHPKASLFVSYKGFWLENVRNSHEVSGGISYNLNNTQQINLYTGSGIGPGSPKFVVGAFISVRLDRFAHQSKGKPNNNSKSTVSPTG